MTTGNGFHPKRKINDLNDSVRCLLSIYLLRFGEREKEKPILSYIYSYLFCPSFLILQSRRGLITPKCAIQSNSFLLCCSGQFTYFHLLLLLFISDYAFCGNARNKLCLFFFSVSFQNADEHKRFTVTPQ